MFSRGILVKIENFFPTAISFIVVGFLLYLNAYRCGEKLYFNSIDLGVNYKELLSSILTIVTIFIALITTVETLIVSLSEHNIIKKLQKNNKAFNAFIAHLFVLVLFNIVLVIFCLTYMMYEKQIIALDFWGVLFLFSIIYSFVAFCWVEFLFFSMIKKPCKSNH